MSDASTPAPVLDGQVAVVTGGAQGLGLEIARGLLDAGARVAIADVDDAALERATSELADAGEVAALQVDLADPDAAAALPDRVVERLGRLDAVVNNAGIRAVHDFVDHPLDDWRRTFAVNVDAPFLVSQAAARHLISAGGGSIVNVTSVAAELSFGQRSAYNASKAALTSLTRSMAMELGRHAIRCNAVAPGIVETPLNAAYLRDSPLTPVIVDGTPLGHWGSAQDLAGPVVFLCSPAAAFVTGSVITVDGGWTTWKGY
jgi:NAD(P)-dependent dehydrogenase (short-subunit alcohol dehydrogenase family)